MSKELGVARRNRKNRNNEDGRGKFYVSLIVIVFIAIAAVFYTKTNPIVQVNRHNFCPIDPSIIKNRTTFLIDTTETLASSQIRTIQNRIRNVIDELNEFDKVDFYVIQSSEKSGVKQYEIDIGNGLNNITIIKAFCIPQENNWDATPLQAQAYSQLQNIVAEMFIKAVSTDAPQPYSPILDALRFIAADNSNHISNHSIYIASDMLENTTSLSMYSYSWYEINYLPNKNVFLNSRPQFQDNSTIYIWALMRPGNDNQGTDWVNFWNDMIRGIEKTQNFTMERITGDI